MGPNSMVEPRRVPSQLCGDSPVTAPAMCDGAASIATCVPPDRGCRACSAARRSTPSVGMRTSPVSAPPVDGSPPPDASSAAAASSSARRVMVRHRGRWCSAVRRPRRLPPPPAATPTAASSVSRRCVGLGALLCAVLLHLVTPAQAKVCEVPRFTKLPPPIVYRTSYPPSLPKFVCSAFPPSARVVFLQRRPNENFPTTLGEGESRGTATYEISSSALYTTTDTDYFCRAHTDFGHLLSRPFRIVKAKIYPYSDKEPSQTVSFYKGNIAQVRCSIPSSQPAATVQFLKDGVVVGHSDKYLEARQPGVSWVALLIKEFSSADVGNYSCKARNPASMQEVESKATTKLTLQKASSAFQVRFHKAFPFDHVTHQRVTVREGENVTLYCLPEGAPIPSVKWFRQSGASGGLPKGATLYPDFGAVRIDNVRPEHASTYTCSVQQGDRMINKAFELKVQQRLKIAQAPRDQIIETLGSSTELGCEADGGEGEISIQWYYNGLPINSKHDTNLEIKVNPIGYGIKRSVLKVKSVTTDLLGIYQCVAKTSKEWTSASAAVYMKGDELRRGEATRKHRTAVSPAGITAMLTCSLTQREHKLYDVKWYKGGQPLGGSTGSASRFIPNTIPPTTYMNLLMARKSDSGLYNCRFYRKGTDRLVKEDYVRLVVSDSTDALPKPERRTNYPHKSGSEGEGSKKVSTNEKQDPGGGKKDVDRVDPVGSTSRDRGRNVKKMRKTPAPFNDPANDDDGADESLGLTRPSARTIYDNLAAEVTWNYTGPGEVDSYTIVYKVFDSRPQYTLHSTKGTTWSSSQNLVTNYHKNYYLIADKPLLPGYSYKFRVIVYFKNSGRRLRSKWSDEINFLHILPTRPRLVEAKVLSPTAVKLTWEYHGEVGIGLNMFVINYRERIDEHIVDGYRNEVVENGDERSFVVSGLKPGTYYQFIVYGVLHPANPAQRRVTLFSNVRSVQTGNNAMSNKWTLLVLGCLAALLLVVVAILMCACLWKQKKEKRRMRASALQAALNGTSIDSNYKDPKFLVPGTNSASSQLLLSNLGDGAVWQQQHQQHHHGHHQHQAPLPNPRMGHSTNGGLRLNVNPEAASLMMNYDERFVPALPPPPPVPAGPFFGNGTLRQSLYATRTVEDPLYATRLHPAYAVTSPVGSVYPLPAPLGGPPGRFSPYAVAVPPMHANGDGAESVYSYFSQQEAGTQHADCIGPTGVSRTVDRPRHHRRKRRRPTNNTSCSQSGMESGSETGAPHMKDMAVNTDMSSSDAIYESSIQASTTASPPPRMGALMMGGIAGIPGISATTPSAYKSPPGGPEIPPPPPPAHPVASVAALSTPLTSVASSSPSSSSGPPSSHTLTRRGTPNLFLDPPRVRDYTEYGVAVSPETGGASTGTANGSTCGNSMVPAL